MLNKLMKTEIARLKRQIAKLNKLTFGASADRNPDKIKASHSKYPSEDAPPKEMPLFRKERPRALRLGKKTLIARSLGTPTGAVSEYGQPTLKSAKYTWGLKTKNAPVVAAVQS